MSDHCVDPCTPLEYFYRWERETPDQIYLRQPKAQQWHELTWSQFADRVRRTARFLLDRKMQPGSRVCIFSANSADWFVVDLAIMLSGHVSVPLYPGQDLESANYILQHSDCELIFLGPVDQAASIESELDSSIPRIAMHGCQTPCQYTLEDLIASHAPYTESPVPDPDELFTIIYTSGTSGKPKGVMHSHITPGKVVPAMLRSFRLQERQERFFSYLPLSHVAERILVEMNSLYSNSPVSFSEGLATFNSELRSVKPTFFFSVPRLWSKFKESVDAKIPPEVQAGFGDAEKAQVREQLGLDQARFLITGSAPCPKDVQQWFIDMGLWLRDAYGMTENCIDGCLWLSDETPVPGCVGTPLGSSIVRITDEGEICFKSDGLMQGYYKEPQKTAEVVIDDWYHTGDSGHFDDNGNLWVTGRLGDTFKTTKGKFIKPTDLEDHFGAISLLAQRCVIGHGKDQPILLANKSEIAQSLDDDQLVAALTESLSKINAELPPYERVSQIFITDEEWQTANGLLTPTMKLKRKAIEARYLEWVEQHLDQDAIILQSSDCKV